MSHEHVVIDTDKQYVIDPIMRTIKNVGSSNVKTKLMQKDHNSERFSFEIDKTIEGHDMSQCNSIHIYFSNTDRVNKSNKSTGDYEVVDLEPKKLDDTKLIFTWLIDNRATKYAGNLSFFISFQCVDPTGLITYRWSTDAFTDVVIGEVDDSAADLTEEEYDELETWKAEILEQFESMSVGGKTLLERTETIYSGTINSRYYTVFVNPMTRLGITGLMSREQNTIPEYVFIFTSGEIPTVFSVRNNWKWANNQVPEIKANTKYIMRIFNDVISYMEVSI